MATAIATYRPQEAADNIVSARTKAPIATLADLDRIPWIGPVAFDRLANYATHNGYVDAAILPENSAEARGILELVNTADDLVLDMAWLSTEQRDAVLAYRQTKSIESMVELDAIPSIDTRAIALLLEFAMVHDFSDLHRTRDRDHGGLRDRRCVRVGRGRDGHRPLYEPRPRSG